MSQLVMGSYKTTAAVTHAAQTLSSAYPGRVEAYSPFPIHGMDDALQQKPTKLPWLALIGGLSGLSIGAALQIWTSTVEYPIVTSGKALLSLPAFVPVMFELTILLTAFATVFGMFILNRIPQYYRTEFNYAPFDRVTDDTFIIGISVSESDDIKKVIGDLESAGATEVEHVQG